MESELLQSWQKNAQGWTTAVREHLIGSRVAVTNRAVLEALGHGHGRTVLDLGCGEGWLTRELSSLGWKVTGVDAIPELIETARTMADGDYRVADFEQLKDVLQENSFHTVVANFSLLGEASVETAISTSRRLLEPAGRLVIQTLHPSQVCSPYRDGWRMEDWSSLGELQLSRTPWYFRTLSSWFELLHREGFGVTELKEPRVSDDDPVSSLLLNCRVNAQ